MATQTYQQLKTQLDGAVTHYAQQVQAQRLQSPGGLAVSWTEILTKFVATATQIVQAAAAHPEDRRQAVIDAALDLWRQYGKQWAASAVGHPFLFNTFIGPVIEKEIPVLVGGMYDGLLAVITRLTGGTTPPAPPPSVGNQGPAPSLPSGFIPY